VTAAAFRKARVSTAGVGHSALEVAGGVGAGGAGVCAVSAATAAHASKEVKIGRRDIRRALFTMRGIAIPPNGGFAR
jgi:hypothetical protein